MKQKLTIVADVQSLQSDSILQPHIKDFFNPEDQSDIESKLEGLRQKLVEVTPSISDPTAKTKCKVFLDKIPNFTKNLNTSYGNSFTSLVEGKMPNIVYYSSYGDLLPFEILVDEADKNQSVRDFAKIARLDLQELKNNKSLQSRRNISTKCSAVITGDFRSFWQQDKINLTMWVDGDRILFGINEDGKNHDLRPDQRSQGFRWFLSFYLRLMAERDTKKDTIILLDEPGLYLHANAQDDVLKVLEDLSKTSKIIVSTHSPYLINPDKIDRIRIVQKSKRGTQIESKIHKGIDQDALKPIINAIGFDLSKSLGSSQNNVLTEGICDYYYLRAFCQILNLENNFSIIPGAGATKVINLASIMMGWGLDFVAVFDNDREGNSCRDELVNSLSIDVNRIFLVPSEGGGEIEDLFTRKDFLAHVVQEKYEGEEKNSELIGKYNKVLKAKKFLELSPRLKPENFDKDTINRFEKLLQNIRNSFVEKSKKDRKAA
jgi:predicted ATP-dependent endonuclease of OLD family